jgi:hypothetical protein
VTVARAAEGADPVAEEALLRRLVERTTLALAAQVGADGALHDPGDGAESPADHYGATFTALALATLPGPDPRWRALVARWAAFPAGRRGHAPFNRLALLLLRDHLQRRGALEPDARELLARALSACPTAGRHPSNNWVLLAAGCALLEAPAGRARTAAAARVRRLAQRWFTPAGAFIDAPASPAGRPVSTPLAYHAKALVVLRLAARADADALPPGVLARGLASQLAMTDGRGLCGGFGRSSHALFGTACQLFVQAEGLRLATDERARRGWALGLRRLRQALEVTRREDGLLPLAPNPAPGAAGGWDEYMHLSVYDAWLAGLLGWLLARPPAADDPPLPAPDFSGLGPLPEVTALDRRAGLLAVRGPRAAGWLALQGQPAQGASPRAADLRWGGARPFHLALDGQPVVAPPVRVEPARLLAEPALAGWAPLLESHGRAFVLQRFERCDVHADGPRVLLVAHGAPVAACPQAPARGTPGWWLENVDHLLLGDRRRRRLGEQPEPLPGARATLAFLLDAHEGWCAALLLLAGAPLAARLLNPWGRALLPEGRTLPLRAARWTFAEAPAPAAVGGLVAEAEHAVARADLPAALPGGQGACGAPLDWPRADLLLATVLGPAGARPGDPLPLRVEAEDRRLVTAWASLSLQPPP